MQRRRFIRVLAAGGAVIALPGCDSMPASAVQPWQGPPAAEADPRLRALAWALLAPNPHNLQSWVADIREPGLIRLQVDLDRLLPATDPVNRQILLGCGAFTELLAMAAAADGFVADVDWLPEGDYADAGVDARPFAHVRLRPQAGPGAVVADPLFAAVRQRRTNRAPYDERVPPAAALAALAAAARRPGVAFDTTAEPQLRDRLRDLSMAGSRIEFGLARTWAENAAVARIGAGAVAAEPSGVPVLGARIWVARHLGLLDEASVRDPQGVAARGVVADSVEAARRTPAWGWLTSADNTRRSQLESGRAYLRVTLAAAAAGLALQPNSQSLQEFPEMAAPYRDLHDALGVAAPARIQMLVRLGYAAHPDPAPRRPLSRLVRA